VALLSFCHNPVLKDKSAVSHARHTKRLEMFKVYLSVRSGCSTVSQFCTFCNNVVSWGIIKEFSLIIVQQLNNKSMVAHKFCELLLVNVCVPLDRRLPVFFPFFLSLLFFNDFAFCKEKRYV